MPSGNNGGKKKDEPPRELNVDNLVSIAKSVKARISAESKRTQEMETSGSVEREEASATPSTASSEDSSGSVRSPTSASTSALEPDRRQLSAFRRDSRDHPETAAQIVQKQKERRDVERRVWEKRIAEFEVEMHYVNREIESISALKTAAGSDKEKLARLDERFAELESKSKCLSDDVEIYTRRLAEYPEL